MIKIHIGDCTDVLTTLPSGSVHMCMTSPPYWGQRDYGTAEWEGGDAGCDHAMPPTGGSEKGATLNGPGNREGYSADGQFRHSCGKCAAVRVDQQIGLEQTAEEYIATMVDVFREVKRVLRDDGTLWCNMGGGYVNKQMDGMPWRLALALQADGWWLRSDIIWAKPNPMPESVTDRPTKAHEYIFLLAKSKKYYYDQDAIKEPITESSHSRAKYSRVGHAKDVYGDGYTNLRNPKTDEASRERELKGGMKNKRTVWTVPTRSFRGAHFATFPPDLIEPCILAGCPEGGTVLDPFGGAGTVGLVAQRLDRNATLIELNPDYAQMAADRIKDDGLPMFKNDIVITEDVT